MTGRATSMAQQVHTSQGQQRSISDDDLCSDCVQCDYAPGEMSGCKQGWPGEFAHEGPRQGYCVSCPAFAAIAKPEANWRKG